MAATAPTTVEVARDLDDLAVGALLEAAAETDALLPPPYDSSDRSGTESGTTPSNLAPLCRRHHRAKTAEQWSYERTDPGIYLWTGPAGLTVLVTPRGTVRVPTC